MKPYVAMVILLKSPESGSFIAFNRASDVSATYWIEHGEGTDGERRMMSDQILHRYGWAIDQVADRDVHTHIFTFLHTHIHTHFVAEPSEASFYNLLGDTKQLLSRNVVSCR